MFTGLLNRLHETYGGNEIYIPDAIYPLIQDWMEKTHFGHTIPGMSILKWKGKRLFPYDEEEVLKSYQSCPIHVPERILEKSIVIETSLVDSDLEPKLHREEVKKPRPKQQEVTRKVIKKRRVSFL